MQSAGICVLFLRQTCLTAGLRETTGLSEKSEFFSRLMERWEREDRQGSAFKLSEKDKEIFFETLEEQRKWPRNENRVNPKIDEEIVRRYLLKLNMEEERLRIGQ